MELNHRLRIGSRLRELREAQGLTTTQLGERCGLTQSTISKVENGKWSVSLDILSKVCEVLGAKMDIVKIIPDYRVAIEQLIELNKFRIAVQVGSDKYGRPVWRTDVNSINQLVDVIKNVGHPVVVDDATDKL